MEVIAISLDMVKEIDKFFDVSYEAELDNFIPTMSTVSGDKLEFIHTSFMRALCTSIADAIGVCKDLQDQGLVRPRAVRDLKMLEWRILRDTNEFDMRTKEAEKALKKIKKENPWKSGMGYTFHALLAENTLTKAELLELAKNLGKELSEKRATALIDEYTTGEVAGWVLEISEGEKYHISKKQ